MNRSAPVRHLTAIACLLASLSLATAAHAATTGQELADTAGRGLVGSAAPKLLLTTIDGQSIDLGALYGKKAVYLKFWATWCVPCRQQMPHLEHTFETAGPDLAVIAIDVGFGDSLDAVRTLRQEVGLSMPIVFDRDGQLGAAFNLRVTPQHIVIGRDGRIQYVGHLADERLDAALVAARRPWNEPAPAGNATLHTATTAVHFGVGDSLPAQSAALLGGRTFEFQPAHEHRPTVFVFLSPWCESYLATTRPDVSSSCRNARQQVTALAGDGRVRWLGIASGLWAKREDLLEYQQKYQVTVPLTLDASGTLFREFRVNDVPTVIIADSHGRIVQRVEPSDAPGLKKALDALL
jgi:thiol-disulfide isomerase/thioredoxin